MDTLLKVVGAATLFLILGVALVVLVAVIVFKLAVARAAKGLATTVVALGSPRTISLAPLENAPSTGAEALARELEALGFVRAGNFGVLGVPDYEIVALTHEAERVYAAAADHPSTGPHVDLFQADADGGRLTVTSTPEKIPPARLPDRRLVRRVGAGPTELWAAYRENRLPGEALPTPPEGFASSFEEDYRIVMAWHYANGTFGDLDEGVLDEMDDLPGYAARMRERMELTDEIRRHYLAATGLSALDWQEQEDRTFFIHDRMDEEELEDALAHAVGYADKVLRRHSGGTPRERVRAIVATGKHPALSSLGSFEGPLPFDAYLGPEIEPPDDDDEDDEE